MMHYCGIPDISGDYGFSCTETEDGYFAVNKYKVSYCPFCGEKAPKEGPSKNLICNSFEEEERMLNSFVDDYAFQEYCDKVIISN